MDDCMNITKEDKIEKALKEIRYFCYRKGSLNLIADEIVRLNKENADLKQALSGRTGAVTRAWENWKSMVSEAA